MFKVENNSFDISDSERELQRQFEIETWKSILLYELGEDYLWKNIVEKDNTVSFRMYCNCTKKEIINAIINKIKNAIICVLNCNDVSANYCKLEFCFN